MERVILAFPSAGTLHLLLVGPFADNVAMRDIEFSSGGLFDNPTSVEQTTDGSITLSFELVGRRESNPQKFNLFQIRESGYS